MPRPIRGGGIVDRPAGPGKAARGAIFLGFFGAFWGFAGALPGRLVNPVWQRCSFAAVPRPRA